MGRAAAADVIRGWEGMVPASPDHAPAARGPLRPFTPLLTASERRPTEPSKNVGVPVELGARPESTFRVQTSPEND